MSAALPAANPAVRPAVGPAAPPVGSGEFSGLMERLAPFEGRPAIAVGVSGGADSSALAWLAHDWTAARGGRLIALTVDHGLRQESASEARRVSGWFAAAEIEHHVLRWLGPKPVSGLQAKAREARFRLLTEWCRKHGVLHLLLAHHRDDQAETVALRLAKDSGDDGLAAMPALGKRDGVRILRPLLDIGKQRLEATLAARDHPWIVDPSNFNTDFARVRVRQRLRSATDKATPGEGAAVADLAALAGRKGLSRRDAESAVDDALVRWVRCYPEGYATIAPALFSESSGDIAARVVARLLMCIGGQAYPPRRESVARLLDWLRAGPRDASRTLHGCRMLAATPLLVVRESPRRTERDMAGIVLAAAQTARWDGRFQVRLGRAAARAGLDRVEVRRLGRLGWNVVAAGRETTREGRPPLVALLAVPSFWHRQDLLGVPHLGFAAPGLGPAKALFSAEFRPLRPLAPEPRLYL